MSGAGIQAMKRIPRIKFPQRHPKSSSDVIDYSGIYFPDSGSQILAASNAGDAAQVFYSGSRGSTTLGGKASLQPRRTPVSNEEIEAVLLGGCI